MGNKFGKNRTKKMKENYQAHSDSCADIIAEHLATAESIHSDYHSARRERISLEIIKAFIQKNGSIYATEIHSLVNMSFQISDEFIKRL